MTFNTVAALAAIGFAVAVIAGCGPTLDPNKPVPSVGKSGVSEKIDPNKPVPSVIGTKPTPGPDGGISACIFPPPPATGTIPLCKEIGHCERVPGFADWSPFDFGVGDNNVSGASVIVCCPPTTHTCAGTGRCFPDGPQCK
jgi:hypothetical protein